jgi:hypothetical protein
LLAGSVVVIEPGRLRIRHYPSFRDAERRPTRTYLAYPEAVPEHDTLTSHTNVAYGRGV